MAAKPALRESLVTVLGPVVGQAGMDLEDVEVTPAGRRRLLRVVVDRDGGVSLDDVAAVSTAVSAVLDDSDVMGGLPYVLEVTSPGVDRPLTEPRHWRRARGRLVRGTLAGGQEVTGRLTAADEAGVALAVDGNERAYTWDQLLRGRIEVEFNRPDAAEDPEAAEHDPEADDDPAQPHDPEEG